ncbi:MAG: hypothetical protein IT464_11515 [Planctomycetes bacterium]|nr:hypothetical protein [Planctomycetota bacterium]
MQWRILSALSICVLCGSISYAVATATLNDANLGMCSESSPLYVSSTERLKIEYQGGIKVRVFGDGTIAPATADRSWFVVAEDGAKYEGEIFDADPPQWKIELTWSGYLYAYGAGSGGSNHWALAATWGSATGDVAGHYGAEREMLYSLGGRDVYSTNYSYADQDGTVQFAANGIRKSTGGFEVIPTQPWVSIDETLDQPTLEFRIRSKGWMALQANSSTTSVTSKVTDGASYGHWSVQVEAWDLGPDPDYTVDTWVIE